MGSCHSAYFVATDGTTGCLWWDHNLIHDSSGFSFVWYIAEMPATFHGNIIVLTHLVALKCWQHLVVDFLLDTEMDYLCQNCYIFPHIDLCQERNPIMLKLLLGWMWQMLVLQVKWWINSCLIQGEVYMCVIYPIRYVHCYILPYFVVWSWLIQGWSRVASQAMGQSYDCPIASEAILKELYGRNWK